MAAYELFAATTPDLMIQNIKNKAEAYGWTIDFFGTYLSHNRLHLHNADGSHFEIWFNSSTLINILGCTGYSSGDIPTAQPGTSSTLTLFGNYWHFIVVGIHSIFIKGSTASSYFIIQIGTIVDKVGSWTGGHIVSGVNLASAFDLWPGQTSAVSQAYINGVWSTPQTTGGGGVRGICESELYTKMPFAYSGGIIPVPMLLGQYDYTTPSYIHPIGYAPDFRSFNGGDVYQSLEPITIDGAIWLPFSRFQIGGVTAETNPDTLILLAS